MDKQNDHLEPMNDDAGQANERFLINEGLDLLSAFRNIPDEAVRKAILTIVAALAQTASPA